jgi:septal ring factor EnvC (AmiA/AmiB activator)
MDTWVIFGALIVSIPALGIISDTIIRWKRTESSGNSQEFRQLAQEVKKLKQQNSEMQERIANIETIVASTDWETLLLLENKSQASKQLKRIASALKDTQNKEGEQ